MTSGSTVPEVTRQLGVFETAFHCWKRQYGGMSPEEAKRIREHEKGNARPKKMPAEQAFEPLDVGTFKEMSQGNGLHP